MNLKDQRVIKAEVINSHSSRIGKFISIKLKDITYYGPYKRNSEQCFIRTICPTEGTNEWFVIDTPPSSLDKLFEVIDLTKRDSQEKAS